MDIKDVIAQAFLKAKGKATPLATTSTTYVKFLALANMIQKTLIREPGIQWDWTYDRLDLGAITSDRVTIDDTIYAIHRDEQDPIVITTPNSTQETYWRYVQPGEFKKYRNFNVCTQIGDQLIFSKTFGSTDAQYSGIVTAPVHVIPDDFVQPTDSVLIPDPTWLAFMMAAEFVRNTVTKQNQLGNIVGEANNLLDGMKDRNSGSITQMDQYPSVIGESFGGGGYASPHRNSAGEPLGDY